MRAGATVVLLEYDLCPRVTVAEIVRQMRSAITWVYGHISDYGGDPSRLYLSGLSAGGHLVAMALAHDWEKEGLPRNLIKGAIAISGVYDLDAVIHVSVNEEIRLNPETARENSPFLHPPLPYTPLIVAVGGGEPRGWKQMSEDFFRLCKERGVECEYLEVPDAHHYSYLRRASSLHAMGDHVRRVAAEHENVRAHIRYSEPLSEERGGRDYDDQGRVDIDLLRSLLPSKDFDFYLCGPAPFMKSMFNGLLDWGVPEVRINYEFFGPASVLGGDRAKVSTAKRAAEVTECCGEIEVVFSRSGVKANWNPSFESILDLAEANGLSPDYSCRSGICHTCVCKLEEGEVEYVLEPLDPPDPGSALICCSQPKTNIVVDV